MATLNIKNFPQDLYDRLVERARRERRSMAQEVTSILEGVLNEPEGRSILELRGLGAELWQDVDGAEHIRRERDSWD